MTSELKTIFKSGFTRVGFPLGGEGCEGFVRRQGDGIKKSTKSISLLPAKANTPLSSERESHSRKTKLKKIFSVFILFTFLLFTSFLTDPKVPELQKYCLDNFGTKNMSDFIYVSVKEQKLYLVKSNEIVKSYPISTSKYGVGELANTLKTPKGLHYIRDKQGQNAPLGGILVNGKYTGQIANIQTQPIDTQKDDVTTRILWLMGCEHGVNRGKDKDSFCRLIYIHGTPEEGLIGRPASHGCIRMLNKDVIDLYNKATLGMYVLIL